MREVDAWMLQAESDYQAACLLAREKDHLCHAAAKCQQGVEKAIKGVVFGLSEASLIGARVQYAHGVERYLATLLRLPRRHRKKPIQQQLFGVFDQTTRGVIRVLDALAPRRPPTGAPPAKNTEYPFCTSGRWRAPAEPGVFHDEEIARYRRTAFRVVTGCSRIVSAIKRKS